MKVSDQKTEKISWGYALSFTIRKDIDSGEVEKRIKELGSSVKIIELRKALLLDSDKKESQD